jgi:hypothetical protein
MIDGSSIHILSVAIGLYSIQFLRYNADKINFQLESFNYIEFL